MKNSKKNNILMISLSIIILLFLLIFGLSKQLALMKNIKVESRVVNIEEFNKDRVNNKALGWLKVPGTNIDYPIIKGADDAVFEEGDIQYLWTDEDVSDLNRVINISGHNIMNLSSNPIITDETHRRFEQLMSFTYPEFASENQIVQLSINNKDYIYQIFAVSYIRGTEVHLFDSENDANEEVDLVLEQAKKNTIYKYDIDVDRNDTVISLITCTRMFGYYGPRVFKVDARLLRDGEKIKNHKVTKTEKYEDVDKQMRGEVNDEEAKA